MKRGCFITLEGGEGAGKSTQSSMLGAALEARGLEVLRTREPGGTPGAEKIRRLLLDNAGDGWGTQAEALLFAAARSDHVHRSILPALEAGKWVICDRFVDSSRAYQGGAGGLSDKDILELHRIGSGGLLPDLTLLIQVDPTLVAERLDARDGDESDRIGSRDAAYHAKVAGNFARLAEQEPGRFAKIDGNGTAEEVHRLILQAVEQKCL